MPPMAESLLLFDHQADGGFGILERQVLEDLQQMVVAKLLLFRVHGLIEAVAIDEERLAADIIDALALVVELWP